MSHARDLLVGLVILAAIVVAVVGSLWLKGARWGRQAVVVEVLLADAAQLHMGNPVKFRGVKIGQVTAIEVEPSGNAVRVTLNIDSDVVLPPDAVALLAPESFFGDWQAEIVSRRSYPVYDYYEVPKSERTRGVRVLGGYALPEFSRLTASADQIAKNLASLTDRLEVAFNDSTAENVRRAIENIQVISNDLRTFVAQQTEVAVRVTASADSALGEIEGASRAARSSFDRIDRLLADAQVDTILSNIRLATGSIQRIAGDLTGSTDDLNRTLARADSAFARVNRISSRLEAGQGALGKLLVDSTLAVRAGDVLDQLNLLLADLRENPRRYVRLSIF